MEQGEIWYVVIEKGESLGHEYQKNRPALIIQANDKIKIGGVVSAVSFTSKKESKSPDDILVVRDEENGLFYDSILKVQHIRSFDYSRFIRRIGTVSPEIMGQMKHYLKKHFDLE